MNRTPLWIELSLFIALILVITTAVMSLVYYRRNRSLTIENQKRTSQEILRLKMSNLESYLEELASFSVLPVYDSTIYSYLQSQQPLSETAFKEVQNAVRTYYYTRNDLLSYRIHLLNQNTTIGRTAGQHFFYRYQQEEDLRKSKLYAQCAGRSSYYAIFPPDEEGAVFRYGHAMIRLPERDIIALVEFTVNASKLQFLSGSKDGEIICLFDDLGNLIYADSVLPEKADVSTIFQNRGKSDYLRIGGKQYLMVSRDGNLDLSLVSLIPVSDITEQIRESQILGLFWGILILLLALLLSYVLIRYLSRPLGTLSDKQSQVGTGNFAPIDIGGCLETKNLSDSYNHMTSEIKDLIEKNYTSQINEKTARLTALEAQVNPHFLYNTLQAIGSEALLNDQPDIYTMLVSLASNLRYSIKAPNTVLFSEELQYTDNYIYLQKLRMGEKLTVIRQVDDDLLDVKVPKVSLQLLVENSILHGISGDKQSITITLRSFREADHLIIQVTDNGVGIEEAELNKIRDSFREQTLAKPAPQLGLSNLYNRLYLMYREDAKLEITSSVQEPSYTTVSMVLPISREARTL
ncbi:MAG: histidine kinase [Lachnospiraceae bacterium]|nr:histidine kinase [Lachnospiraceae bacterium]